jgi:hypothetical protein
MTPLVVLVAAVVASTAAVTVTPLLSGMPWMENLFIHDGALFATSIFTGNVTRIVGDGGGGYESHVWVTLPSTHILGLSPQPQASAMYVVGHEQGGAGNWVLWSFSTAVPNTFKQVAVLPASSANNNGNGVGVDTVTGRVFVSAEGNYLNGGGTVYVVDPSTGSATVFASHTNCSDGLWVDSEARTLYVGELLTGNIERWDIGASPAVQLASFSATPALSLIDDFTVSAGRLVFAHYGGNSIEAVTIPPPSSSVVTSHTVVVPSSAGIKTPTSCRYGDGSDAFPATSLFVTEGDILSLNNRVLRVDF